MSVSCVRFVLCRQLPLCGLITHFRGVLPGVYLTAFDVGT